MGLELGSVRTTAECNMTGGLPSALDTVLTLYGCAVVTLLSVLGCRYLPSLRICQADLVRSAYTRAS